MITAITNPKNLGEQLTLIAINKILGCRNQVYSYIPILIKYNQLHIFDNTKYQKPQ